jgi:hypothetical protein
VPRLCARELLRDLREHAGALRSRVAVERLVLEAHRARVAELEECVHAVGDSRATLAVHARDVRARLLDVLQVHVEETVGQLADGVHRVVSLRRPPARVDRRPERAGIADRSEHLGRGPLGMVLEPEPHTVRVEHLGRSVAVRVDDASEAGDQVDVEIVRQAACRLDVGDRAPDAACEGDHPDTVTVQGLACDRDMLRRRPPPVEVSEPEVDRVVSDAGDGGE